MPPASAAWPAAPVGRPREGRAGAPPALCALRVRVSLAAGAPWPDAPRGVWQTLPRLGGEARFAPLRWVAARVVAPPTLRGWAAVDAPRAVRRW